MNLQKLKYDEPEQADIDLYKGFCKVMKVMSKDYPIAKIGMCVTNLLCELMLNEEIPKEEAFEYFKTIYEGREEKRKKNG